MPKTVVMRWSLLDLCSVLEPPLLTGIFRLRSRTSSQKSVSFLCSFQGAPGCARTHLLPPLLSGRSTFSGLPVGAVGRSWALRSRSREPSKRYRQEIFRFAFALCFSQTVGLRSRLANYILGLTAFACRSSYRVPPPLPLSLRVRVPLYLRPGIRTAFSAVLLSLERR